MSQSLLKSLFAIAMLVFTIGTAFSQGVTTSGLNGRVSDSSGETLPGANVVATHMPSGSRYGAVTNLEGRYSIPGMRVGGPYTVEVSFIGYETAGYENVFLSLGQTLSINIELKDDASDLQEVVVTAVRGQIFDGNRTGASTSINSETINNLPTISRSIQDYARLSPLASETVLKL